MDFKQVEAFVNVVRFKSFSKAADATFFTQPTISTHIRNLEKELGVKLLDRRSRAVEMTPYGAKFYKYAVEMLNARSLAVEALRGSVDKIEGILEIQTSSIPGVTFLPEFMTEFREMHPDIQYYVSLSDTQSVIDNISERRGEIGFIGTELSNNTFITTKIASDKVVMIAPKSYGLSGSISMSEAIGYPFIWRETGSATRNTFEAAALNMGYKKDIFDVAALFDDMDATIKSVEAGLGVAVISQKVAAALGNRVAILEINDFKDPRDFYMIQLRSSSLSPAAEAFAQFIKDSVKDIK
ncbi:MAG: LysR family transcriptional regulator [Clostridiales bacterium]|nr:LysR family transcriptional regulator [Clostridiales bacterium]